MTHYNQTKELTTWFLNLPLDESIDNNKETKKLRKAQEGHLEEGKPQKPTKGTKGRKITKKQEKLKIKAKAQDQHSP
jgi:hypothetical protein